jgi:hypothetical protein
MDLEIYTLLLCSNFSKKKKWKNVRTEERRDAETERGRNRSIQVNIQQCEA